jgi:hypothetical protein
MTDSLSKERLEEIANWNLGHDVGVYSEARTMARAILAAYEQEPVAWTDEEELRDANEGGCGYLFGVDRDANKFADPRRQIMLYRHAQQPVVPEEKPMPKASSMHAIDAVAAIAEVKGWNAAAPLCSRLATPRRILGYARRKTSSLRHQTQLTTAIDRIANARAVRKLPESVLSLLTIPVMPP